MPRIVPIVEGYGEIEAVPLLLRRIIEHHEWWDWSVTPAKRCGGLFSLKKRLAQFIGYAQKEADCAGILVLLDLDDGCPKTEAQTLADQIQTLQPTCPVAIVLAHREYEAWFLASLETIGGHYNYPADLVYDDEVEKIRGVKAWLTAQLPAGKIYKETTDQAKLSHRIDLDLAQLRSRSFRRLCHAVEELVDYAHSSQSTTFVTP